MSCVDCSHKGPVGGPGVSEDEEGEFPSGATNPCKLCTPLGACLAYKGVQGCVPLLHGSQGCATYIRRYCISHFREPIDIASSNFSEDSAVFGGRRNLHLALDNVSRQYRPELIGVATTCLSETMGENMPMLMAEYLAEERELPAGGESPALVHVATPSFKGTHMDGFHKAVRALVETFAGTSEVAKSGALLPGKAPLALFPGMVSPADLRHLLDLFACSGLPVTLLPDYSETLDGASWSKFERLPEGGTPLEAIRRLSLASHALELGRFHAGEPSTAGTVLEAKHGVKLHRLGLPVGLRETDAFFDVLEEISGERMPARIARQRGRLVDSYVDGHKYLSGKRAVVFGEGDLVVALASFLAELGVTPVLCASGERKGWLERSILEAAPELTGRTTALEGADFSEIEHQVRGMAPDLLIGSSKGHKLAKELKIPLLRCGFPVHDRIGAQRLQMLGYEGTQRLFDELVNLLLEKKQDDSSIGYSYL